jgi:hypothetical protein
MQARMHLLLLERINMKTKDYVTSLEQRYKIAVNTLIDIAKSGWLYPSKKEAKKAIQTLIWKTPDDYKLIRDPNFEKELMEILKGC